MGDHVAVDQYVPTKEELYQQVDEAFHREFEDAPEALDPDDEEHAEWRDGWLRIRDELLATTANGVYWNAYPDAPTVIDPRNPAHARYADAWNDIHAKVMANQPMPPMGKGTDPKAAEAGLGEIRPPLYEALADMLRALPAKMHPALEAAIDKAVAAGVAAVQAGQVDVMTASAWMGDPVEIRSDDADPWVVKFQYGVMSTENHGVTGWIEWSHDDPTIEIDDPVDPDAPVP
jgi:AcrR family transcriptional regulator